jgi:hypothetical protein
MIVILNRTSTKSQFVLYNFLGNAAASSSNHAVASPIVTSAIWSKVCMTTDSVPFQHALFFARQEVIGSQRPLLFMLATHVTVDIIL